MLIFFALIAIITKLSEQKKYNITTLIRLRSILREAPSPAWSYSQYKKLQDLYLNKDLVDKGIENRGLFSQQAVIKQLEKGIRGENVMLYVLGESVSVGAELGKYNQKNVFHYALANWWNHTVGNITGSKMSRRVIAVGGVSSRYFEKCLQEYVTKNDNFDMALWEFNINDKSLDEQELQKTLQKLISKLYVMNGRVDLVFTVFYDRSFFYMNKTLTKRHQISETVILNTAFQYSVTSLNIEPFIKFTTYDIGEMELVNGKHPSVLAHAQMALLLVKYYTTIMIETLDNILRNETTSSIRLSIIDEDLSKSETNSTCWTAVTPDFNNFTLKHSLFDLPANMTGGFMKVLKAWQDVPEDRVDYTAGYYSRLQNETLDIKFKIENGNECGMKNKSKVYVAYRIDSEKSSSSIEVKGGNKTQSIIVPSNSKQLAQLIVAYVGTFSIGDFNLRVRTIQGGILVCAIIIT